jgi:hypothetical protein
MKRFEHFTPFRSQLERLHGPMADGHAIQRLRAFAKKIDCFCSRDAEAARREAAHIEASLLERVAYNRRTTRGRALQCRQRLVRSFKFRSANRSHRSPSRQSQHSTTLSGGGSGDDDGDSGSPDSDPDAPGPGANYLPYTTLLSKQKNLTASYKARSKRPCSSTMSCCEGGRAA